MMDVFSTLDKHEIEEKYQLNKRDWGYHPHKFKEMLQDELFQLERQIIQIKFQFTKQEKPEYLEMIKELLPYEVQVCNLKEQIAYMENRTDLIDSIKE